MTHIVTRVTAYDRKRMKVTLDEGDVTFLLYNGEARAYGIRLQREEEASGAEEQAVLSEESLSKIFAEVLVPRAKKRCLYYLKNGDHSESQIRRKLTEGLYPEEVISEAVAFLRKYRFADDRRFAENLLESYRGLRSRREIEAKLYEKGVPREVSAEVLLSLTEEDEGTACRKALSGRHTGDRKKDLAYLLRKGFSYESCEMAFSELSDRYGEEEN